MSPSPLRILIGSLPALVAAVFLAACGGGGSADGEDGAPTPTPQQAGTVGILITDGPTDQFAEINATITEIALLGGGPQRVIFSGDTTIDLLALDSHSELFALANDIQPGTFNKIRLTLSSLELVRRDAAGNVVERIRPRLPGNGKLDLSPRGSFTVAPGQTLLVELDVDLEKSIHIVATGNDRVQFRPVIFVRILQDQVSRRLARISGVVEDVDAEGGSFDLCQLRRFERITRQNSDDDDDDGMNKRCIEVFVDDDTGLFADTGDPMMFDALAEGAAATAVGLLRKHDDDDDDEDDEEDDEEDDDRFEDDVRLDAVVIEVGEPGSFSSLSGTIASALDTATNRFDFDLAAAQGFAPDTTLSALVQDGTRIFSRDGTELDGAALEVDLEARIDGVVQLSATEADTLKSALIVVDTVGEPVSILRGNILTLDAANSSFNMSTEAGDRCVRVPAGAAIILLTIAPTQFTSERGEFGDLVAGQRVDVFGDPAVDGCLVADVVIAQVTAP